MIDSHWPEISAIQISNHFEIPRVQLLNSTACASNEVLNTSKDELIVIQEGEVKSQGGSIVVGVSQFLGECHIISNRTPDGELNH